MTRATEKPTQKSVAIVAHCNESCMQRMGMEQVRQLVWCELAIATYAKKYIRVNYIFKATFKPGGLTVRLPNGCVFFQKVLETPPGVQRFPVVRDACSCINDRDVALLPWAATF